MSSWIGGIGSRVVKTVQKVYIPVYWSKVCPSIRRLMGIYSSAEHCKADKVMKNLESKVVVGTFSIQREEWISFVLL